MDVKREGFARKKRIRMAVIAGSVLAGIVAISFGLSRLEPAAPSVNRATVWMDSVERGEMIRQVRGPGTLEVLPEAIRWVAARTRGRVERRVLLPGVEVEPSTIILELSNPELDQELRDAEFQLQAQEAEMANLQVTVESQLLSQKSMAATVASEFNQAKLQAEADERLFAEKLIGDLILKRSRAAPRSSPYGTTWSSSGSTSPPPLWTRSSPPNAPRSNSSRHCTRFVAARNPR